MSYRNFEELFQHRITKKSAFAVVCAEDPNVLKMSEMALGAGIGEPLLIGDSEKIKQMISTIPDLLESEICHAASLDDAVAMAIRFVRDGRVKALVKGHIDTASLMKGIVNKESGLRTGALMSHLTLLEMDSYHKLIGLTDGALIPFPDFEKKKEILKNAVSFFRSIGCAKPKVAVLAPVESVTEKFPETLDAAKLETAAREGQFGDCIVEGPISYDLAMRSGATSLKEYESQIAGEVDLFLVPYLTVGNVLLKALTCSAGARGAGVVLGAEVPVVLTSRSSSADTKFRSLALAMSSSPMSF